MLYLNLCSRLTIECKEGGKVMLDRISSAEISNTIEVLGDTAVVVIPKRYGNKADGSLREYLAEGDRAILELGYNGEMNVEFEGYIREVESGFPMKLHLDDETYTLRKNSFVKSWKSVTLKEVLQYIAPDYEIECHDTNLGKFQIDSQSTLSVLRELKTKYGFYTSIKGKKLICKFKYETVQAKTVHVYDFSKNVKKSSLRYKRKEDKKIRICAVSYSRDGKKIKEEVGDKDQYANTKTLSFTDKTSKQLRELATAEYNRVCFDGFEGTVTGYGIPLTKAGDTLELISEREPERDGKYLIESVRVRYGNAYYERINKLSYKV
jgi:hypothetical protein